jgi:hypothetical protein
MPIGIERGDDPYWDFDESDCANCHGEGFIYGCSWDWQCDTYDEGEGSCLCIRPCEWCHPPKPDPELSRILAQAIEAGTGETEGLDPKDESAVHAPKPSGILTENAG